MSTESTKSSSFLQSFPRTNRLLTPKDFDLVFNNRDLVLHNSAFTYFIHKSSKSKSRLCFVIAKKKIKHAVQRNRAKRNHREIFRQMQHLLPPCDIVVLAKNHASTFSNSDMQVMIKKSLNQIPRKLK